MRVLLDAPRGGVDLPAGHAPWPSVHVRFVTWRTGRAGSVAASPTAPSVAIAPPRAARGVRDDLDFGTSTTTANARHAGAAPRGPMACRVRPLPGRDGQRPRSSGGGRLRRHQHGCRPRCAHGAGAGDAADPDKRLRVISRWSAPSTSGTVRCPRATPSSSAPVELPGFADAARPRCSHRARRAESTRAPPTPHHRRGGARRRFPVHRQRDIVSAATGGRVSRRRMRGRRIVRERWATLAVPRSRRRRSRPVADRRGVEELHHSPTTPAQCWQRRLRYIASLSVYLRPRVPSGLLEGMLRAPSLDEALDMLRAGVGALAPA